MATLADSFYKRLSNSPSVHVKSTKSELELWTSDAERKHSFGGHVKDILMDAAALLPRANPLEVHVTVKQSKVDAVQFVRLLL